MSVSIPRRRSVCVRDYFQLESLRGCVFWLLWYMYFTCYHCLWSVFSLSLKDIPGSLALPSCFKVQLSDM